MITDEAMKRFSLMGMVIVGALFAAGSAHARRAKSSVERRLARLEAELAKRPMDVGAYSLPGTVKFCGEQINVKDPWIRERLEKEFILILGDRAQVLLWTKRARHVFPVIEAQAAKLETCADLKYVAVIESGLRPAETSHASAKGWWQFMSGTARQYGLDVDRAWDERTDLSLSTKAGLKYLASLRKRFGSWSLAMAAYNTGPGRLRRARAQQKRKDYWRLDLYTEAERYVPRIIAAKIIMSDLSRYGFAQGVRQGWPEKSKGFVRTTLSAKRSVKVLDLAIGADIDLRVLKALNPELGTEELPTGRAFTLAVPKGREDAVRRWLGGAAKTATPQRSATVAAKARRAAPKTSAPKASAPRKKTRRKASPVKSTRRSRKSRTAKWYTVRGGDSLWSVAQDHKVSVGDIRRWNKLTNQSLLRPGQRLVVRPGS
ncbi:MAG: membrane-bound lytic murein transglycosylase D [Bradymonadia bacterium]|jgi:membrane-bound lytic murein transglycosylase D